MKPAIVIGCGKTGLSVVWSLGREGVPVIALQFEGQNLDPDIAQCSKYVVLSVKIVNPKTHPDEFVGFLLRKGPEWKGSLLIPVGDPAVKAVSTARKILSRYYVITTMDWPIIKMLVNKRETYALAKSLDIPVPKSFYPDSFKFLETHKNDFTFPCIIKPLETNRFFCHFRAKVLKANNIQELQTNFQMVDKNNIDVMISEIVPGNDDNHFEFSSYVSKDGEFLSCFLARKVRQDPPGFGVARVIKSQDPIPELKRRVQKILKELSYSGISQFEFKLDAQTGEFILLEINPRVHMFMNLPARCGVNLAYIMYMDMMENKKIKTTDYDKEIYWIDVFADVRNLVSNRHLENWSLSQYVRPYLNPRCFAVLAFDDPRPFLAKTTLLAKTLFSHLFRNGLAILKRLLSHVFVA